MAPVSDDKIMTDIKRILMVPDDYDVFDLNLIIQVNSVFSTLQQLGVGPKEAFLVVDMQETWTDFFGEEPNRKNLMAVKTYMGLRVRLLFDPPTTSFALDAIKEQIKELEWRLNVQAEEGEVK